VIFKQVGEGRPYPDHGLKQREWAAIPPRQIRLDQLVTTKRELALDVLLDEDSTFYGDLFPHVVEWDDTLYLEDGLHRAVRAALQQRNSIHARVHIVAEVAVAELPAAGSAVAEEVISDQVAPEPTESSSHT
jgi:Arc/MetJ family transcription regulator